MIFWYSNNKSIYYISGPDNPNERHTDPEPVVQLHVPGPALRARQVRPDVLDQHPGALDLPARTRGGRDFGQEARQDGEKDEAITEIKLLLGFVILLWVG